MLRTDRAFDMLDELSLLDSDEAVAESALVSLGATFSFQVKSAKMLPRARKSTLRVKGPVGPSFAAVIEANCPARIATNESPAYAQPKVSPNHFPLGAFSF